MGTVIAKNDRNGITLMTALTSAQLSPDVSCATRWRGNRRDCRRLETSSQSIRSTSGRAVGQALSQSLVTRPSYLPVNILSLMSLQRLQKKTFYQGKRGGWDTSMICCSGLSIFCFLMREDKNRLLFQSFFFVISTNSSEKCHRYCD